MVSFDLDTPVVTNRPLPSFSGIWQKIHLFLFHLFLVVSFSWLAKLLLKLPSFLLTFLKKSYVCKPRKEAFFSKGQKLEETFTNIQRGKKKF